MEAGTKQNQNKTSNLSNVKIDTFLWTHSFDIFLTILNKMSNAPESQSGEDLLGKLTTAMSVDAASGSKASMAVARQIWRQRPGNWKAFFNRWTTTGIRTRLKVLT